MLGLSVHGGTAGCPRQRGWFTDAPVVLSGRCTPLANVLDLHSTSPKSLLWRLRSARRR